MPASTLLLTEPLSARLCSLPKCPEAPETWGVCDEHWIWSLNCLLLTSAGGCCGGGED